MAAASAQAAQRQTQMTHSGKLVKAVEALSAAVSAKAELDIQADARAREAAARERRDSAITSLRGELEFSDPMSPRYAQLRDEIRVMFATPVSNFMDAPVSAAAGRAAAAGAPSSTASTPGPTLVAAATSARATLPGFAGVGGVGAGVGGGAVASSASGVTAHVSV